MEQSSDTPLLTVDDLRRMVAERDLHLAKARAADEQIQLVRKFIGEERFVAAVGPAAQVRSFDAQVSGPKSPASPQASSFIKVIIDALQSAPEGVTYDDLRVSASKAGIGAYSPNTLFNSVARLVHQGVAVKAANRIYSKAHYASLSPEQVAALENASHRLNTPQAVLEILKEDDRGMMAGEVIEKLAKRHPYLKGNAAYAALSRMTKDRVLVRDAEGRYWLSKTYANGRQQPSEQ